MEGRHSTGLQAEEWSGVEWREGEGRGGEGGGETLDRPEVRGGDGREQG